ncbi:hypothetical protein B0H67DRAFT_493268 [Lasiosphaeris hirsuta]|uniref:T6SS Phospholipase effector Tle1-like catalytic domain-containing protein n=1 Tax=Lasiosphaeris hirsuta TaxID=260670 RepID=A0AA40A894_9PEZI|nr:hypothetical protein B0H67DRAFT_493268 [Lasiosphaeris hirsuta]
MATKQSAPRSIKKRLTVCCDGTWQNSDRGYSKPTLWNPVGKLQTPSNVTRLSRSLRRICTDGTVQIIEYQSGVGTGGSMMDIVSGGAFGLGISENIRSAYAFICANYCDGDEIILVGFSRQVGAFTARSIAGMIANLGLLTRAGMEFFYPIFKDTQNWRTLDYEDPFPGTPFDSKPKGEDAQPKYQQMLLERGLTRVYVEGGKEVPIRVKAVAVWDTVGSLGIPNVTLLSKVGLHHSTREYRFYDTDLSNRIEYAFQALALDEHRLPFSPTVWERGASNRNSTKLRQVWFPGNHSNIGGGWQDACVANMSLAWMMDQLASIGVEFDEATIARIFTHLERYYREIADNKLNPPHTPPPITSDDPIASSEEADNDTGAYCGLFDKVLPTMKQWAVDPIYKNNDPVRPWALGAILSSEGFMFKVSGYNLRTPGRYKKVDPDTGFPTRAFLEDTNERIHSSVRVRLALKGLGLNDKHAWTAPALKGSWRLRKTTEGFTDAIPEFQTTWEHTGEAASAAIARDTMGEGADSKRGYRWVWEYCGAEADAPPQRLMVEEPLGPYERQLLRLSGGRPNVYEFAGHFNMEDW